jgi:hypothetical protein
MPNLWDDPGFEGNLALTSVGTPSTSARSNTVAHSGTYSWKVVTDAAGEGVSRALTTVVGTFYKLSAWVYVTTSGVVTLAGATKQNGSALSKVTTAVNVWQRLQCVFRATGTTTTLQFTSGSGVTWYLDDVDCGALTAVTLTVTPASAANSTETSGLRNDGRDTTVQNVTAADGVSATAFTVKTGITPRHSAAVVAKFGELTPYWFHLWGDATNYAAVYWSAANTLKLEYNAGGAGVQSQTWDATAAIVAGTTYALEVMATPTGMILKIGDVTKATITAAVNFSVTPTVIYWGSKQDGSCVCDATFQAPA